MELILLNIGFEAVLISGKLDTILARMTSTTTFVATPLQRLFERRLAKPGRNSDPQAKTPCGEWSVGRLILLGTVGGTRMKLGIVIGGLAVLALAACGGQTKPADGAPSSASSIRRPHRPRRPPPAASRPARPVRRRRATSRTGTS